MCIITAVEEPFENTTNIEAVTLLSYRELIQLIEDSQLPYFINKGPFLDTIEVIGYDRDIILQVDVSNEPNY